MIEAGFRPLLLVVAVLALASEMALVPLFLIVLTVTIVTEFWGLPIFQLGLMAAFAFALLMRAKQFEVSAGMVKFFLVERRDVGRTSLVIGMAIATVVVVQAAMQARFAADVAGNILMAVETQLALRRLVETLVALLAFLLVLGMPGNDLAGHQHLLDTLCQRASGQQHGRPEEEPPGHPVSTYGRQRHARPR